MAQDRCGGQMETLMKESGFVIKNMGKGSSELQMEKLIMATIMMIKHAVRARGRIAMEVGTKEDGPRVNTTGKVTFILAKGSIAKKGSSVGGIYGMENLGGLPEMALGAFRL